MDKLSPNDRERITKSSTTRIKAKLEELGLVEADIEKMDRKSCDGSVGSADFSGEIQI